MLQRCDRCGRFRFIPSELCTCGSAQYTWTPIAGTGEVYTYTVVHRAPTPAYQADAPYVIAHVTMDEGPRMISTLVGSDPGRGHDRDARRDHLRRRHARPDPLPLQADRDRPGDRCPGRLSGPLSFAPCAAFAASSRPRGFVIVHALPCAFVHLDAPPALAYASTYCQCPRDVPGGYSCECTSNQIGRM